MKRFVIVCLGCLVLLIAIAVGIVNEWIDLVGHPIQRVRELQPPAEERNRQIEHLAEPGRGQ